MRGGVEGWRGKKGERGGWGGDGLVHKGEVETHCSMVWEQEHRKAWNHTKRLAGGQPRGGSAYLPPAAWDSENKYLSLEASTRHYCQIGKRRLLTGVLVVMVFVFFEE